MTLALLITAVTSAWAQGDYYIDVNFASYYDRMETIFHCTIMNPMDPEAEIKGTLNLSVDGESKGIFNIDNEMFDGSIAPVDAGNHTWSAVFSPNGGGSFNGNGNFTINKLSTSIAYYGSTSINMGEGESTELDVYVTPDGTDGLSYSSSDASVASITKKEYSNDTYIIEAKAAGTATITFSFAGNNNYKAAEEDKTITVTVLPAPIKVTTDAASEGATFTEAWFNMPANDMTAEYELVRDMSIQMTATMGDGTDGLRYRVKKSEQGEGYEPAEMNMLQVLALVEVYDGIEQKDLTLDEDYFCRIYKLDEQTHQPEGDGVKLADFDFAPGLYALKAFATDGSDYDGETALSNTFQLFQGYPVEIAAQSFATYYSDEALTLEDSFAETAGLYTVSEVTPTEAVLSEKIDVMPKRTPMLIYNESDQTQQILLIPTADVAPLTDVADEFKGTAVEKEVTAEEVAATNFYVLTDQNQFVWVKDAGTIAAHRCWLEIAPSQAAGARRIVFSGSETTGIDAATLRDMTTGDWYDLNGRKLNGMPTKKGVYIFNGRKVVVK